MIATPSFTLADISGQWPIEGARVWFSWANSLEVKDFEMILALCYYETDSSLAPNIAVDSITLEEIDATSSVVSSTSSTELTI